MSETPRQRQDRLAAEARRLAVDLALEGHTKEANRVAAVAEGIRTSPVEDD